MFSGSSLRLPPWSSLGLYSAQPTPVITDCGRVTFSTFDWRPAIDDFLPDWAQLLSGLLFLLFLYQVRFYPRGTGPRLLYNRKRSKKWVRKHCLDGPNWNTWNHRRSNRAGQTTLKKIQNAYLAETLSDWGIESLSRYVAALSGMAGWYDDFMFISTIFQSYQDDAVVTVKDFYGSNPHWPYSPFLETVL